MGDSELAREFRRRFSIIMVPLLNPDGVVLGHWRHNVNGVDLNRDGGLSRNRKHKASLDYWQPWSKLIAN